MKILELKLKKDVLIVDLPQKVQNFKEVIITNNVLFADGKGNRTCLFIIFRDKLDNEGLNEYLKKGLKRIVLDYIEGEFEYKCRGSELTEEIASELVKKFFHFITPNKNRLGISLNSSRNDLTKSAKESFISAVESKSFHWLKNPIKHPKDYEVFPDSLSLYVEQEKLHLEAEEKTFRNPLIFVKKS